MSNETVVLEPIPDELQIELSRPITFDKKTVEALELREPTIGQLEEAIKKVGGFLNASNSLSFMRHMIQFCSAQPAQIISQLPMREYNKCVKFIELFINPSEETQKKENEQDGQR